ncbi:hypothetical protein BHM03_00052772 [Ensete ventricosum]|nr:hypothetical protein BHM03_00052772 [Ensete ventricosum]
MLREEVNGGRDNKGQEARGGGGGGRASEGGGDLSFPRSVKPIVVSLPSTSPAHDSVAATSTATGIDFCTTLPLHMVGKFVSFLSIGGRSPVSLVVEVLLLSTASSSWLLDRCPFFLPTTAPLAIFYSNHQLLPPSAPLLSLSAASSAVPAASSRYRISLMSLLSSTPTAQATVADAVLFLCQLRYCLPPLYCQSCEQDRPDRASPVANPSQLQQALLPLCSSSTSPSTCSCHRCNLLYQELQHPSSASSS